MDFKPNYYSVLPANVRYCKKLTFFEIVLYSELTALANKNGYCFASNNYFAKLYGKAIETVSRAISNLEKLSFIRVVIDKDAGNQRKIYITPIDKNVNTSIDKNVNTSIDENVKYNNINNNNIKYNINYYNRKKIRPVPDWYHDYIKQLLNDNVKEDKPYKPLNKDELTDIVRNMLA